MDILVIASRLSLAMVLGGLVGLERQSKHRPAGFRTHILVCMGSALIMCLSEYIFLDYSIRYGVDLDPMRLGAQVISGIGFLGAGTIIISGANVKGLTTAAGLWAVACIGLAVGAGFYTGALITTGLIMLTLFTFSRVSRHVDEYAHNLEIIVETVGEPEAFGALTFMLSALNVKMLGIECVNSGSAKNKTFKLALQTENSVPQTELIGKIAEIQGIVRVERL